MLVSSGSLRALEVASTTLARRPRRYAFTDAQVEAGRQRAVVLVTGQGHMRVAPLVAAMSRELAPGSELQERRHAGLDIVCLVLGGALRYEPAGAAAVTLRAESVAVLSTGAGVDYRWRSIGDEPAHVVMLWMLGKADGKPRMGVGLASRVKRLGSLVPIAGRGTELAVRGDVRVMAGVLPVGGSLVHVARGPRSYVMSTIGAITANGIEAAACDGVVTERSGAIRISARESTEVVVVETR
jgi:redox-sensitive bicupin YhaK (pirin superfamily)